MRRLGRDKVIRALAPQWALACDAQFARSVAGGPAHLNTFHFYNHTPRTGGMMTVFFIHQE